MRPDLLEQIAAEPAIDGGRDEMIEDLLDLCAEEIEYLLTLVRAKRVDRVILRFALQGHTDRQIAEMLHSLSGREYTADAVKMRRRRLIQRMTDKAGVGLGWITVLIKQFPCQIHIT